MSCQRRSPGGRRQEEESDVDSEDVISVVDSDIEDFKFSQIQQNYRVWTLEELAQKLLQWKKPDEDLAMQKTFEDDYDSLVKEHHLALKYHGLDVECKEGSAYVIQY